MARRVAYGQALDYEPAHPLVAPGKIVRADTPDGALAALLRLDEAGEKWLPHKAFIQN